VADLVFSTQIPSGAVEDFNLITVGGRLLLVAADFGGQIFTWEPSDDRWTRYPLDLPYRPADFLSMVGRLPACDEGYRVLTVCAAVVDGRIVIGGGNYEEPFAQWDLTTGKVRTHARLGHAGVATTATIELDGRPYFLAGGQSGLLSVWEASRRDTGGAIDAEPVLFDAHWEGIGGLTGGTVNDRPVVLSADWNGHVVLWDVRKRTILREFEESGIAVKGAALATVNGRVLALVAGDNQVMLGNPDTGTWEESIDAGEELGDEEDEDENAITCMDVGVADGRPIAVTGAENGLVCVWDLQERRLLHGPFTEHDGEVTAVRVTDLDGRVVAITAGNDGYIHVWRL
jgi:WD40 repeat protein